MKEIKNTLNEALRDTDKGIFDMLNMIAQYSSGVQQALFKQKANDADSVDLSPLSDVLSKSEISMIKKHRLQKKECYRNAFVTCECMEGSHDVRYVEGYMNYKGLPIEHAFCKIDGKYVDPTGELVLKQDPSEVTYVVVGEFETSEVREVLVDNGYWGNIYDSLFLKKYKENVSSDIK